MAKLHWLMASALMSTIPAPAWAQSSEPPVPAQDDGALADIIVTATKVEINTQDIPIAISVFTGDDLIAAGVTRAEELTKLAPGVQVETSGSGAASIFIRGIGTSVLNAFAEPGNAFSVDGVYFNRANGLGAQFYDIGRVEVVKGPQGTLYGRNATGGAVNIVTTRPSTNRFSAVGSVEGGSYNLINLQGGVNLPVSDTLALRIAGRFVDRDGYLSDGYYDEKVHAVRVSALWEPSDTVSLFLSGDHSHNGGKGFATVAVGPGPNTTVLPGRFVDPSNPYLGPSDPRVVAFSQNAGRMMDPPLTVINGQTFCLANIVNLPPPPRGPGPGAVPLCGFPTGFPGARNDGFVDNDNYGLNATLGLDFEFATLTGIAGYRKTKTNNRFYIGPAPQQSRTDVDQYSGEIRLASNKGAAPFDWIIGAFFLREEQSFFGEFFQDNLQIPQPTPVGPPFTRTICNLPFDPDGAGPAPVSTTQCLSRFTTLQFSTELLLPEVVNQTYAVFGQFTLPLTDQFRITGGIRFTEEAKETINGVYAVNYTLPATRLVFPTAGRVEFNDVAFRAGAEFDLGERSLLYASFATGFHAGGINAGIPEGPNAYFYVPERVKAYTVGSKNRFLDNRLQLNLEAFWYDYKNLQVSNLGPINDGTSACSLSVPTVARRCTLSLRTDNAATARIRGVEADIVARVLGNGTLSVNALYTDAIYKEFVVLSAFGGANIFSNRRIAALPEFTISAGYSHRFETGFGSITPEVRTQFRTDTWMNYERDTLGDFQKAYTRTDLSLRFATPDDRFSITGYVRNVEDKATLLQGRGINAETDVAFNDLNPPRTWGAILGFRF